MIYRDNSISCPSCGVALSTMQVGAFELVRCGACGGAFVTNEVFAAMWADMAPGRRPPAAVPRKTDRQPRPCPRCTRQLVPVAMMTVPLDQCEKHGLWFDADELSTTLAGAALPFDDWLGFFGSKIAKMR